MPTKHIEERSLDLYLWIEQADSLLTTEVQSVPDNMRHGITLVFNAVPPERSKVGSSQCLLSSPPAEISPDSLNPLMKQQAADDQILNFCPGVRRYLLVGD